MLTDQLVFIQETLHFPLHLLWVSADNSRNGFDIALALIYNQAKVAVGIFLFLDGVRGFCPQLISRKTKEQGYETNANHHFGRVIFVIK